MIGQFSATSGVPQRTQSSVLQRMKYNPVDDFIIREPSQTDFYNSCTNQSDFSILM